MSDFKYTNEFEKLCKILKLGELVNVPRSISGGFLHKMYYVETNQANYAIKILNPKIMLRSKAMMNFIDSEQIANISSAYIPALPAKIFNESSIQEIDNQFFLVFEWVEGHTLKQFDIESVHCEVIGSILASIHKIDFSKLNLSYDNTNNSVMIDWNFYLQKGIENNAVWVDLLGETIDKIYIWNDLVIKSAKLLSDNLVISHRDLDSKNVLWEKNTPLIIDWESSGFINPMQEMVETAIYWSETETGGINKERFYAFIRGYKSIYGQLQANWSLILPLRESEIPLSTSL